LITNNAYLSPKGTSASLRELIVSLAAKATGIIYPEELFEIKESSARL
jgi:hypothetical protein